MRPYAAALWLLATLFFQHLVQAVALFMLFRAGRWLVVAGATR
jgi:hypothetical protein